MPWSMAPHRRRGIETIKFSFGAVGRRRALGDPFGDCACRRGGKRGDRIGVGQMRDRVAPVREVVTIERFRWNTAEKTFVGEQVFEDVRVDVAGQRECAVPVYPLAKARCHQVVDPRIAGAGVEGQKRAEAETANSKKNAEADSDSEYPASAKLCHKCHTKAVVIMDNCATCLSCGYSKCG